MREITDDERELAVRFLTMGIAMERDQRRDLPMHATRTPPPSKTKRAKVKAARKQRQRTGDGNG